MTLPDVEPLFSTPVLYKLFDTWVPPIELDVIKNGWLFAEFSESNNELSNIKIYLKPFNKDITGDSISFSTYFPALTFTLYVIELLAPSSSKPE